MPKDSQSDPAKAAGATDRLWRIVERGIPLWLGNMLYFVEAASYLGRCYWRFHMILAPCLRILN